MKKALTIALLAAVALAACKSQPDAEVFVMTRLVEITVTVISEVEVTQPVEITRLVEVVVEVTRETEEEVTRIVYNLVTATPRPTRGTTVTPTPTARVINNQGSEQVQPAPSGSELLAPLLLVRKNIKDFGFNIDNGLANGYLVCPPVIDLYNRVAAAPTYDVSGSSAAVQNAYQNYQDSLSIFLQGVESLTLNCRNFVLEPTPAVLNPPEGSSGACIGPNQALGCRGFIPPHQWMTARVKVNEADDLFAIALSNLE